MDGLGDPLYHVWVHQLKGMRDQMQTKSPQEYADFLEDQIQYIDSLPVDLQERTSAVSLWLQSERRRLSALFGDIQLEE